MKPFGKTIRITSDSKIRLPKSLLETLNINPGSHINLSVEKDNYLVIRKASAYCIVTGKITHDYDIFFNQLAISREGQQILLEELKERLKIF